MILLLLGGLAVLASLAMIAAAVWVLLRVDVEAVVPSQDEQVVVVEIPNRVRTR